MELEREMTILIGEDWVDVTVTFEVTGAYRPAVIRMDPDDSYPEEVPDVGILSIIANDTGEELDADVVFKDTKARIDFENRAIDEAMAARAEAEADARLAWEADAYDRYYDR